MLKTADIWFICMHVQTPYELYTQTCALHSLPLFNYQSLLNSFCEETVYKKLSKK